MKSSTDHPEEDDRREAGGENKLCWEEVGWLYCLLCEN